MTPYYYRAAAAANQDSTAVKASGAYLLSYEIFNTTAAIKYLKLYNKATAPTSADTPVKVIMLPASSGANMAFSKPGANFATGLGFRITTGSADNDATAVSAGDVVVNLDYI